jgi:hypothetical protein
MNIREATFKMDDYEDAIYGFHIFLFNDYTMKEK